MQESTRRPGESFRLKVIASQHPAFSVYQEGKSEFRHTITMVLALSPQLRQSSVI